MSGTSSYATIVTRWPASGLITTKFGTFRYRQWPDRSEIDLLVNRGLRVRPDRNGNRWKRGVVGVPDEVATMIPNAVSAGPSAITFADGARITVEFQEVPESERYTPHEVYWGSHGCHLRPDHEGFCECDCCDCRNHARDHERRGCVAKHPYYGPDTRFYGDDAATVVKRTGYGTVIA